MRRGPDWRQPGLGSRSTGVGVGVGAQDFDSTELGAAWFPHYLPQWSSRGARSSNSRLFHGDDEGLVPELVIDHLPGLRIRLILRGYPLSVGVARPESPGATHTLTGYPLRVWANPIRGGRVELRGGDAATNSAVLRRVLAGEPGPVRDVVLLNAAAAVATTELSGRALAEQLAVCIDRCADAIDRGRAVATLERWTAATRRRR
jgi:hypothetical protein